MYCVKQGLKKKISALEVVWKTPLQSSRKKEITKDTCLETATPEGPGIVSCFWRNRKAKDIFRDDNVYTVIRFLNMTNFKDEVSKFLTYINVIIYWEKNKITQTNMSHRWGYWNYRLQNGFNRKVNIMFMNGSMNSHWTYLASWLQINSKYIYKRWQQ